MFIVQVSHLSCALHRLNPSTRSASVGGPAGTAVRRLASGRDSLLGRPHPVYWSLVATPRQRQPVTLLGLPSVWQLSGSGSTVDDGIMRGRMCIIPVRMGRQASDTHLHMCRSYHDAVDAWRRRGAWGVERTMEKSTVDGSSIDDRWDERTDGVVSA